MGKSTSTDVVKVIVTESEDTKLFEVVSTGKDVSMRSSGTTVINDSEPGVVQGYKQVTINQGVKRPADLTLKNLHDLLDNGRAVIGGNVDVENSGISLTAKFDKIPVNAAEEEYKWVPSSVKLSANNGTVNYKSTGKLEANVTAEGYSAASMVVGYKDVDNDGSYINIVFGGEASLFANGSVEFGKVGDDDYHVTNNLKSTGSFYADGGSFTGLATGFNKVGVTGKSTVSSVQGGKQYEDITVFTDLDDNQDTLKASAKIYHEGKATGSLAVEGASTIGAANSFKNASISASTVQVLNGGNGGWSATGEADIARTKNEDGTYNVYGNVSDLNVDFATEAVGKATITDSTVKSLTSYKTIDLVNSKATAVYNGKTTVDLNNAYLNVEEEGLSEIGQQTMKAALQELITLIEAGEYEKAGELAAGALIEFFKDGSVEAGFKSLDFDRESVGKATISENSIVEAIAGVKNVKASSGSDLDEVIGGNLSVEVANASLKSIRDEYTDEETGDACKMVTITKADTKALQVDAILQSTGSFKAYDSSIYTVMGYKNLTVDNNLQQIGGEGTGNGANFVGGNFVFSFTGNPSASNALVIDGSEKRQDDGSVLNPIKIGGSTSGLNGSAVISLESTGSAKITGGKAPVEGELPLKNNLLVVGYKTLTVSSNKSMGVFMGGNINVAADLTEKAENTTDKGGAWSDLKGASLTNLPMALAKFSGLTNDGKLTVSSVLNGKLTSAANGKATIKDGSEVDAVVRYKDVSVKDSSIDVAFGGDVVASKFYCDCEALIGLDVSAKKFWIDADTDIQIEGTLTAEGKFDAKNSDVGTIVGFKTVSIKGSDVFGGTISSTKLDFGGFKMSGDGAKTKLTASDTVFQDWTEGETTYNSEILNYNKVELKNANGYLSTVEMTEYDDTLKLSGNTTLEIDDLDFGKGTDSLSLSSNSTLTVGDFDVAGLEKLSMGTNSVLYLGDSEQVDAALEKWSKYADQIKLA